MEKLNITQKQLENVILEKLTREKAFSVSFDKDEREDGNSHDAKAVINFDGSKLVDVMDDAIARLVIKIQARIKSARSTAEGMAEYIKENDGVFEFNYAELQGRQQLTKKEQLDRSFSQLSPEEQKAFIEARMAEMEANNA